MSQHKPVAGTRHWRPSDLAPADWILPMPEGSMDALLAAVRQAEAEVPDPADLRIKDFPLPPTFEKLLADLRDELVDGRGFAILRGLPVSALTPAQHRYLLCGLSARLGTPVTQGRNKDRVRAVRSGGGTLGKDLTVRGHQTNSELKFHTDSSDLVGLLCVQPGAEGGRSGIASSAEIHRRMHAEAPELAAELMRPQHFHMSGAQTEKCPPTFLSPVFSLENGAFSCRYSPHILRGSAQALGHELPARTVAALDLFDRIAADPEVSFFYDLRQGDLSFCNNHTVVHSRSAYVDAPDNPRELLRLWLKVPGAARRTFGLEPALRAGWLTDEAQLWAASWWVDDTAELTEVPSYPGAGLG